jgi:hypothetical protein
MKGSLSYNRPMLDPRESTSRFGISLVGAHAVATPQTMAAVKRLGASIVRVALPLPLTDLEFDQVTRWTDQNIQLLACLRPVFSQLDRFASDALAAVQRLRKRVRHWEVDSEEDFVNSGWPQDNLATYAHRLSEVYSQIKTADPTAIVHLGGLGRSLPKGLERLYALGEGSHFDIVNIHPYINPLMPDALGGLHYFHETVRLVMKRHGDDDKPIWWSSIACPGVPQGRIVKEWWLGKNGSEKVQADWLIQLYTRASDWNVAKIFWQSVIDCPGDTNTGADYFGLLRDDGSEKQSFVAYQSLNQPSIS